MSDAHHPAVRTTLQQAYRFHNAFGEGRGELPSDLGPPLGQGAGPDPEQLLAAAVANCLSASLLFALRKFKQEPTSVSTEVSVDAGRNAENRVRVLGMQARITLGVPATGLEHLDRVLATFEEFCTVTASVRAGIPVTVSVFDTAGAQLK